MSQYIIARSNLSSQIYVDNNPAHFTNSLLRDIDVSLGNKKIALQSISLSNKFGNVPPKLLATTNHILLYDDKPRATLKEALLISASISQNKFENVGELLSYLQALLAPFSQRLTFDFNDEGKFAVQLVRRNTLFVVKELADWLHLKSDIGASADQYGQSYCVITGDSYQLYSNIVASAAFTLQPIIPSLLKIRLKEMKPSYTGGHDYHQYIGILTGDQISTYPCFITLPQRNYFELDGPTLNSLSISLFDQNDFPVVIHEGPPTTLQFKIKNMEGGGNYFPVQLKSTDSVSFFPNNVANNFKILKTFPLAENKSYQVALTSFFCHSQLDVAKRLNKDAFHICVSPPNGARCFLFPFDDIASPDLNVEKIVAKINDRIDGLVKTQEMMLRPVTAVKNNDDQLEIYFDLNAYIKVSPLFAYLFQMPPVSENIKREKGTTINFGKFTLDRCLPELIELHCSIIHPIIAANTYVKTLKIIPFDAKIDEEKIIKYEASNRDFLTVTGGDNQIMHFELKDSDGNFIPFKNEKTPVTVNLLFKEI